MYTFYTQKKTQDEPALFENNPLSPDDNDSIATGSSVAAVGAEATVGVAASGVTLSKLAKLSRENQELQAQVESLSKDHEVLSQKLTSTASATGPPAARSSYDLEMPSQSPETSLPTDPKELQSLEMKKITENDDLSEELRAMAKQQIEDLVSDQVEAVARRRLIASRADKLYVATMQASMPGKTATTAREELVEWLSKIRLVHHVDVILTVVGEYAKFVSLSQSQSSVFSTTTWLISHRARVSCVFYCSYICRLAAVEDFSELMDEDIARITAKMTRVEASRFEAAITQLKNAPSPGQSVEDVEEVCTPLDLHSF
jgi:cell division protein FtsB